MTAEYMQVLKMVEEGKIDAEQGARLLDAIRARQQGGLERAAPAATRYLKVRVFEGDGEEPNVNVSVPLVLGRLALKFLPHSALERLRQEGISVEDLDELMQNMAKAGPFKLVDIRDGDSKVEVVIE